MMVICNRTYFGGWLFSCQTTLIIKESNNYEMEKYIDECKDGEIF